MHVARDSLAVIQSTNKTTRDDLVGQSSLIDLPPPSKGSPVLRKHTPCSQHLQSEDGEGAEERPGGARALPVVGPIATALSVLLVSRAQQQTHRHLEVCSAGQPVWLLLVGGMLSSSASSSAPTPNNVGWLGAFDCSCLVPNLEGLSLDSLTGSLTSALSNAANAATDPEAENKRLRRAQLQKGDRFLKPALFGLSSQELQVNLSEDTAVLKWKAVAANFLTGTTEFGEVDLGAVRIVRMKGVQGLEVVGVDAKNPGKESVLMELTAESAETRDKWVVCLSELLSDWARDPSLRPRAELTAAGTSNKDAYFKRREEEIRMREKENTKKKEKFGNVGMKYTALAMMERG